MYNAPWDSSRLAVDYKKSKDARAWGLVFSQRISRKTGKLEPNPERPRMTVTSKDSKTVEDDLVDDFIAGMIETIEGRAM